MTTMFNNERRSRTRVSFPTVPTSIKGTPGRSLLYLFIIVTCILVSIIVGLLFKHNFWSTHVKTFQYDLKRYDVLGGGGNGNGNGGEGLFSNKAARDELLRKGIQSPPLPPPFSSSNGEDSSFSSRTNQNQQDDNNNNNNNNNPTVSLRSNPTNGSQCRISTNFSGYRQITQINRIKIWPMPDKIELYDYQVPVIPPMTFYSNYNHDILQSAVKRYHRIIFAHTLPSSSVQRTYAEYFDSVLIHISSVEENNNNDDGAQLTLNTDERYDLIVSPPSTMENCHKILIRAATVYGALRGLETLSQIIRYDFATDVYRVSLAYIEDKPRFRHRGILLDTSRHFHPPAVIKHFLDAMSYAKFNVFHWHVVDEESFPYQSHAYPNLWNGSYSIYERYSENDILEIVEYAKYRGIRVMPEFDTPGHAGSWCKGYPELCIRAVCRKPSPTLLDPSNPLTFEIIEGVIKEATTRFPDQFLHLGMDEVKFDCYDGDEKVREWLKTEGLTAGRDIYQWWTDKVTAIALKYHKRPVVWQEVYKHFENQVPKETIVHLWMGKGLLASAAQNGYDILVSHGWYLDHLKVRWEDYYTNNMFEGIEDADDKTKKRVLGGEACMWSEHIDLSVLDATVWPKAAAAAENLWSENRNLDTAFDRLEHFRCMLISRGVGGGPLRHIGSREAPDNPRSCYQE